MELDLQCYTDLIGGLKSDLAGVRIDFMVEYDKELLGSALEYLCEIDDVTRRGILILFNENICSPQFALEYTERGDRSSHDIATIIVGFEEEGILRGIIAHMEICDDDAAEFLREELEYLRLFPRKNERPN